MKTPIKMWTKRRSSLTLCVSLSALCLSAGCEEHAHGEEAPPEFEVTHPVRQDTEISHRYVAQIRSIRHIEVRALEGGYLRDIFVDEGQHVSEGDQLFQITPAVYRAEVARSEAEVRAAEVEYQNTRSLNDRNVVSDNEVALAHANLERANAARTLAQTHLGFAGLRAPFDGIVGRLHVRRGSLLEEGELLTELSDNSEMWVYFNVSEAEYLEYQAHRTDEPVHVELRMANGELFESTGVIQTIEAEFNNRTGTIAFRAGFPNPDGLLRHGETGEVIMRGMLDDAMLIPQKATFSILDKTFVYLVDEQGRVHAHEIHVGQSLPHLFVVESGLSEDDTILIEGLRRVRENSVIQPRPQEPEAVFEALDVPAE